MGYYDDHDMIPQDMMPDGGNGDGCGCLWYIALFWGVIYLLGKIFC